MKIAIVSSILFLSSISFAQDNFKVMCVEKSFSANALRISVRQTKGGKTLLKKFSADNSVSVEADISDATYLKNGKDFKLEVDRGSSGHVLIEKAGNNTGVAVNLSVPEMAVLNTNSSNFTCNGY